MLTKDDVRKFEVESITPEQYAIIPDMMAVIKLTCGDLIDLVPQESHPKILYTIASCIGITRHKFSERQSMLLARSLLLAMVVAYRLAQHPEDRL